MSVINVLLTVLAVLAQGDAREWNAQFYYGRPRAGLQGAPEVSPCVTLPSAQYYEFQRVNHFDGSDTRTWKQRYFVNQTFHDQDGPIFLMLGGEAVANPVWVVDGAWVEWARRYGAMLVLLEHRYYGQSRPTEDMSTKNLEYLSSRQALADAADFVTYFRSWHHVTHNKLIVFGGSYAGRRKCTGKWCRGMMGPYSMGGMGGMMGGGMMGGGMMGGGMMGGGMMGGGMMGGGMGGGYGYAGGMSGMMGGYGGGMMGGYGGGMGGMMGGYGGGMMGGYGGMMGGGMMGGGMMGMGGGMMGGGMMGGFGRRRCRCRHRCYPWERYMGRCPWCKWPCKMVLCCSGGGKHFG